MTTEANMLKERVGILGVGNMGRAIALRLLRSGHEVVVWNRTREKAETLAQEGASIADTPEDVSREPLVLSILSDDRAVEDVLLSQPLPFGSESVHVSASTISLDLAERLTAMHRSRNEMFVAAPVLGRPPAAEAGQLILLTAGSAEDLERCRPLFDAVGQRTYVAGAEPPKGHFAKLAVNFLLASAVEALAEVSVLVERGGLDKKTFLELVSSTAFSSPVYQIYGDLIANERFEPAGFRMPLGLKDVELALAAGSRVGAVLPLAELVREGLRKGVAEGYADLDWSALALVRRG
jgi:3-hydroxyisobutyrate dehydrogenase-like beta-hydroxyacid dehydrogenase